MAIERMKLADALRKIEYYYEQLQQAETTADRYLYLNTIEAIVQINPQTAQYWGFNHKAPRVKNRVTQIANYDLHELMMKGEMTKTIIENGIFYDGISYDAPNYAGLYFIGETHFDPHTKDLFYWVKIGKSTRCLSERMKDYNTHNPMLWRIDFCRTPSLEKTYQRKLAAVALARCNHNQEWFLVDEKTYLEMCEKGFSYFD